MSKKLLASHLQDYQAAVQCFGRDARIWGPSPTLALPIGSMSGLVSD